MRRFKLHIQGLWVALLSAGSLLSSCNDTKELTYADDVQPIIAKNCQACHQPKGGAPFELLTYEQVSKRAKMIAYVTSTGYMPPWPADRHYSGFLNERGLTHEEIETIEEWYKQGAKPGNIKESIPLAKFEENEEPDMIINIEPVRIYNDNRDRFYVLKIPYEIPSWKFVRSVQFIPGHSGYAHHMNGHYLSFTDETNPFDGRRFADLESDSFQVQFEQLKLFNSDGSMPERVHSAVNYLPGSAGIKYPAGIGGFAMSKRGAFVANDIHYGPSRKNLVDSPKLYVYFSDKPPMRQTFELMLGTNGVSESAIVPPLQVPAGKVTKHVSQVTIYNDISVLTINPHMHLIGKRFKAYAIKPNGDTVKLIHIPEWRFKWQYFYTFRYPVKIPKGSTIKVEAEFDNTKNNPNNPFDPPRLIGERLDRGGASMRTTDEMLQFIITYMPYQKDDETIDLSKP